MFKQIVTATFVATLSVAVLAQGTATPSAPAKPAVAEQKTEGAKPAGTVKTDVAKTTDRSKAEAPKPTAAVARHHKHHKSHAHAAKPAKPVDKTAAVTPAK